jgi:hypothetical protein
MCCPLGDVERIALGTVGGGRGQSGRVLMTTWLVRKESTFQLAYRQLEMKAYSFLK